MFVNCRNGSLAPVSANRLATMLDQFFQDTPTGKTSTLPLAVSEDDTSITLELDAPGIPEGNFEVSLHEGVLTITAERTPPENAKRYDTRRYGKFVQTIRIDTAVQEDDVTATLSDGVLTVKLTKTPEVKPKKIVVNSVKPT